jgi:hypothetical protein
MSGCSPIQPTPSQIEFLQTAQQQINELATANPDSGLHEWMQKEGVTLTAKEVQYNMPNNLYKKFALTGTGELCNYYNWGYDASIEPKYFCVTITPSGGYLERWYIYFTREDFSELYQGLLNKNCYIKVIAIIERYENNQDNMATANTAEWTCY